MDKITVIGFTSSGKTSYLAGTYEALSFDLKSFLGQNYRTLIKQLF